MHKVLERQIKKAFGDISSVSAPLKNFLEIISSTYSHFDEDRSLLERSLELSSKELVEINRILKLEIEKVNIQTQKIKEEKVKDEAIISSIGDGLIVADRQSKIMIMNYPAQIMLGWSFSELKDKILADFVPVEDKGNILIPKEQQPTQLAILSAQKISRVYFYTRKDGTRFPVAVTATPVILEEKVIGGILIFRDITKEIEIDKAKSEFVSLASHQLRTPLSTIRWYTEMLLSNDAGKLLNKQREYVEIIYSGSKRMIELINALLNVSRLELGTFIVEPELIKLDKICDIVLKELEPQIKSKRLKIIKNYDPTLKATSIDPKLTMMIFQNLLSNSVRYTPEEGEIKIEIKKQRDYIIIKVADNGYGIPQSQQSQIFTKLFRADNIKEKDSGGSGLGLYIVKSIVDHFGGKVWFESAENSGTIFFVTIPFKGIMTKKVMPK